VRNVTITLEERVAAWARVRAAQRDQSLSRFLSDLLTAQMNRGDEYEAARQAFLAEKPIRFQRRGRYPDRASLHDRSGLR
jgi:hypothetical protein